MNTSDTLNLAADLIEERGWRAGDGWQTTKTPDGERLCLEGGIMAAIGLRPEFLNSDTMMPLWTCPAYRAVADYLDRDITVGGLWDEPAEPLWRWNDQSIRTASEVIEVLRAAAVVEAARESQPAEQVTAYV